MYYVVQVDINRGVRHHGGHGLDSDTVPFNLLETDGFLRHNAEQALGPHGMQVGTRAALYAFFQKHLQGFKPSQYNTTEAFELTPLPMPDLTATKTGSARCRYAAIFKLSPYLFN